MKKLTAMILILCVGLLLCACTDAGHDSRYAVHADTSRIIQALREELNTEPDALDRFKLYELYYDGSYLLLAQYREHSNDDFSYLITRTTDPEDCFSDKAMKSKKAPLYSPVFPTAEITERSKKSFVTRLSFALPELDLRSLELVCTPNGLIRRVICDGWGDKEGYPIVYRFRCDSSGKVEEAGVFTDGAEELKDLDTELINPAFDPEYRYIYNDDGTLKAFITPDGDKILYGYEDGTRTSAELYQNQETLTKSLSFVYDDKGLLTRVTAKDEKSGQSQSVTLP